MRIIVMSDSHGDWAMLMRVMKMHENDADVFCHLGDGNEEFTEIAARFPAKTCYAVKGNNDWEAIPQERLFQAEGVNFLMLHGHKYGVKSGLTKLSYKADEAGADVVLFGHTHQSLDIDFNGLRLINPGSLRYPWSGGPTYAIIDVEDGRLEVKTVEL